MAQPGISDFDSGYIIAVANIVHLHGEPDIAADVLRELGVSWTDILKIGLCEYDMDVLQQLRRDIPDCFEADPLPDAAGAGRIGGTDDGGPQP